MTARPIPEQFASLRPFVDGWALPSEEDRYAKLHSVTLPQLREFYDAMMARLPELLSHVDTYPLDQLPPEGQTLLDLAMTFAHTAHPIDLGWKDVDFKGACDWRKFGFSGSSRSPQRAAEEDADPFAMW